MNFTQYQKFKKNMKNITTNYYKNYNNNIFTPKNNYNNVLFDLLNDNNSDDDKNVMISELDINLSNSQIESIDNINSNKNIKKTENNNDSKSEFKNKLVHNIINFLQNKKEYNTSFNNIQNISNKNEEIPKTKTALNLTSLTPSKARFKTINANKSNHLKINKGTYFIKINKKPLKEKKSIIVNNIKKKDSILKKTRNKFNNFITNESSNNNYNIYKKMKTEYSQIVNKCKSLLDTEVKKVKYIPSINEIKKINSSNIKNNKNTSFIKDNINQLTARRNSLKNTLIKNNFNNLKNYKTVLNSNSSQKETKKKIINNKQLIPLSNNRFSITDNHTIIKNSSNEKCKTSNKLIIKKKIPNKFRNLTLKEINLLNSTINGTRSNCSSFINNTTFSKEKEKNFSKIVYEKKILKNFFNKKQLKIHVKKNLQYILNKKPVNILNININKNNNFFMNLNNNEQDSNKKIRLSTKKSGKIRKFFSLENFYLGEAYKKEIYKKIAKDKKSINKDKKVISLIGNTERFKNNL